MSVDPSATSQQGSSIGVERADDDLLISALNYSTAWYDTRINRGLQVINYLLLSMAILATAYVNALSQKLYTIAATVGLLAGALTVIAFLVGLRQARSAGLARPAIAETQDRIAGRIGLGSFRMANATWNPRPIPSFIVFGIVFASTIGSFVYALTR